MAKTLSYGIPVLAADGDGIAMAWEKSMLLLHEHGKTADTQYDRAGDPPSVDATMLITVYRPCSEPMIHRDMPCGLEGLQEYVIEVCEGIKDELVRCPDDPEDTRWEYTYHQRLFGFTVPTFKPIDQIAAMTDKLAASPHTRRAQAVIWKVWEDNDCYDPACLQSIWCRLTPALEDDSFFLNMNVRLRSNDAYKAAFMNIFAFVQLQRLIAKRVENKLGKPVHLGRYCHLADSYHIYGKDIREFEGRFLGAISKRRFEDRTLRYADVRDIMEEARPLILEKAAKMVADSKLSRQQAPKEDV